MKLENTPRRHRRALASARKGAIWASALLVLLSVGSGAALADDRRGDRDGYRGQKQHDRYDHRGEHRDRDGKRYDRNRRDHRRHDQRVDRHRRHDRRHYDRHRNDRRHDGRYRHDRYRHDSRRHYYDGRYRNNHYRSRTFSVPRVIGHGVLHHYQPYHHGRLYHRAHRHYHQIYRFPVYTAFGVEYYPYAYCEGNFFGRGTFRDGRAFFDIHIRF